jgi:hypothetical protein
MVIRQFGNLVCLMNGIVLVGLDRPPFPPPWPPVATALGLSCPRTGHGLFVQWDLPIKMNNQWRQSAIVQPGLFDD